MTSPGAADTRSLVVYGADWCPDLRRARRLLDRLGIEYHYVNIENDAAARKRVRTLQRGRQRIPTLVWDDGSVLVEPTDAELSARLQASR